MPKNKEQKTSPGPTVEAPKPATATPPGLHSPEYGRQAYKITLPSLFTGPDHAADFAYGTGVLCMLGFSYHRCEWVRFDEKAGGWLVTEQTKLPLFEPLLDFFSAKGGKIERIPQEEAEALLEKIRSDPKSFAPPEPEPEATKEPEKTKGKPVGGKDGPLPHEKV